jgi:hypothetical protein
MPIRVILVAPTGASAARTRKSWALPLTVTFPRRNPCDASHVTDSDAGCSSGGGSVRPKNRVRQLAQPEAGEQTTESRTLAAQLGGGPSARIAVGAGRHLGAS